MLSTAEALQAVLSNTLEFESESVSVAKATGRVLRQSIVAERDQPPFDRVMMDGIGFTSSDNQREFPIQGMQQAGDAVMTLENGKCIEVMTGTPRPDGVDTIVPVERISVADGVATLEDGYEPKAGRHIHPQGSDYKKGDELLRPGARVSPLDIAIIASCGYTDIDVAADPVVRIISTGNELVPAGDPIEDHQIRMSNGPAIEALLGRHGYQDCTQDHIADDVDTLRDALGKHLDEANVLILSGGVSMGKADYVPQVLADLNVDVVFHKVSQRPGKPMWFGKGPKGQLVFALPGNPVSALVCCRQYVVPSLVKASGVRTPPPEFAALASSVSFKPELTCFQPVKLTSNTSGQVIAIPVKTNTSGDFASLSGTDGYVELPKEQTLFDAGTSVFLHRWIAD